jgi:hypothetical protein
MMGGRDVEIAEVSGAEKESEGNMKALVPMMILTVADKDT